MFKKIIIAFFLVILLTPALQAQENARKNVPGAAQDKVFNAQHYTLDNGLEIYVIPNTRAPVITHMVWYRTGAADEPRGKSGIAHFLEHLMFKGSLGFGPGEFSQTIRALGGNDNAFTSQDYTAYYQSIAKQHLELVMRMEAGRMRGLNPPLEEVLSERSVILEERRQRIDNNPQARFNEPMDAALFVNHPYGIPVIGWFHEIANLSWEDAKTFYDRHYGPNNAVLVVTGDVTGEEVYELAKDIYGPLPKIDVPERDWTEIPPLAGDHIVRVYDENVHQPTIMLTMRTPNMRENKTEALALQLIENILSGGASSRLYKSLVVEQKLASNIGAGYAANSWDDAQFTISATPLPGVTPEDLGAAIKTEIEDFLQNGLKGTELNDAKTRLQNDAIYARDSLSGPAMVIGRMIVTGSTLEDIEYWPRDIAAVTPEQIMETARKYLDMDKNRTITGYLLPAEGTQE